MSKKLVGMKLILGMILVAAGGCGHSISPPDDGSTNPNNAAAQEATPVSGVGGIGSQCAFGAEGDPIPLQLTAAGCPLGKPSNGKSSFTISKPLLPIILQADCKKLEVTARTIDGYRIESRWNALPDGRFYFVMDAGNAELGSNGAGASNCETTTTIEVVGLMKCQDRDHAQIEVDATWHLGQVMPGTNPHLTGTGCTSALKGCDLHGFTTLKQCG